MKSKWLPSALVAVGVVLMVAAPIERFAVVPRLTLLPSDTNLKFSYSGTATLLNSEALKTGDTANIILKDLPLTLDREIKVADTDGQTAIVQDNITGHAGPVTLPNNHTYALDRKNLQSVASTSDTAVEPTTGCLAISLPIAPENDSETYSLYDPATQQCFPVKYMNTAARNDRDVYVYESTQTGPLKDPKLLVTLPSALPKATLGMLAPLLPADLQAEVGPSLPSLPDVVPVTYQAVTAVTVAADTQTGLPVDQTLHQQVTAQISAGGQTISLLPVLDLKAAMTKDSVQALTDKAGSTGRALTAMQWIVPIALLIVGLALAVSGLWLHRRLSSGPAARTNQKG